MNFAASVALTCLFIPFVFGQRCFDKVNFEYFSCDQACTLGESSLALIDRCDRLARFGCELRSCNGTSGFECVGPAESEITTCGNSKVMFQDVDITKSSIDFRLDLNTPPVNGDYYFLVNARLAITNFLPSIQQSINDFINSVNGSSTVRFGVGIYRNEDMLDMGFKGLLSLTNNHEQVQTVVNAITLANARGGSDANLQALNEAAKQDFRADTKKIIFMFGDTAGHEPSMVGSGMALTRHTVAKTLKDSGIVFVGINYRNPGLNGPTFSFGVSPPVDTEGGQADFIAKETGGRVLWRSNTVFQAFWKVKANVDRMYNIEEGDCAPFITIVAGGSTFPVTVAKGKTAALARLTLMLKSGFCTPFSCKLNATENGVDVESLMLQNPIRTDGSCMISS